MWPLSSGQLVFDVGANRGDFARSCLAAGAQVVCVEPQDALCKELEALAVDVVHAAVGASEGLVELYVSDNSLYASARSDWVDGHRAYWSWKTADTVTVKQVTLDSLIARFGMPDFVKIDTEGFEDKVMAGLSVPIRAFSLEYHGGRYAVKAADGVTARAIRMAADLDADYKFRFAAESVRWVSEWMDVDGAVGLLDSLDWGDVYVASSGCL
jgi:FkbM family methyltransferase